ncbi:MAG TPA: DNA-formamidopyrimidine glycosylase family protein [Vicinamibacterales bacterium]|nr:DNA-formamidopyrimidine glycosylase family protein [Vicinamibacterales bacterium]
MPELPDIELYLHALSSRIVGRRLDRIRVASPFLVRSFDPPIDQANGRTVNSLRRLGKRLVWVLDDDLFLVIHLMIAGRFRWTPDTTATESTDGSDKPLPKIPGKVGLAAFDFPHGSLILTEAGSKRRASLYLVRGETELASHNPGGLEPLTATAQQFGEALTRENHTLKRALTDPHLLSGIGNAYSDEILHAAKMSPMLLTSKLTAEQIESLQAHTIGILTKWRDELIAEAGEKFPEKVTAFREGMAAHGRYGKPCPACGTAIQRIQYATNEANYCPTCQTGGKLLADRGLSRLLKDDWPKSLEDLERRKENLKRS